MSIIIVIITLSSFATNFLSVQDGGKCLVPQASKKWELAAGEFFIAVNGHGAGRSSWAAHDCKDLRRIADTLN